MGKTANNAINSDSEKQCSSPTIHCAQCGEKCRRNGTVTYYHPMLGAVLVHPDHKVILPTCDRQIAKRQV